MRPAPVGGAGSLRAGRHLGSGAALDQHLVSGLEPAGVAPTLRDTSLTFHYGDVAAFDRIVAGHEPDGILEASGCGKEDTQ